MSLDTDAGRATVVQACSLFGISREAYYAAQRAPKPRHLRLVGDEPRPDEPYPDEPPELGAKRPAWAPTADVRAAIQTIVSEHPAWGVRKVWATLRRPPYDIRAGQRRVWALMKDMGLTLPADRPERTPATRGHVTTEEPNRRWATDLTTLWTALDGLVAVMLVVDCGCRNVLGVAVSKSQESAAVLAPVRAALASEFGAPENVPDGLELRSDHGPQYTGADCEALCAEWHLLHTLAPVGRPTGNSVAERTIRTMKEECLWLQDWDSREQVAAALEAWRHSFNHERPHQALGWQTPAERRAERAMPTAKLAA